MAAFAGVVLAGGRSSRMGTPKAGFAMNLPGQPKAIAECLDAVFPAIPYCIDLIGGPFIETDEKRIMAFRPKKK